MQEIRTHLMNIKTIMNFLHALTRKLKKLKIITDLTEKVTQRGWNILLFFGIDVKPEMWCFWISILYLELVFPAFHTSQEMDMCNFKLSLRGDAICFCSNYCNLSVFDDRWCHLSIEAVISLIQKVSPQKTFQLVNYALLVWITFNLVN